MSQMCMCTFGLNILKTPYFAGMKREIWALLLRTPPWFPLHSRDHYHIPGPAVNGPVSESIKQHQPLISPLKGTPAHGSVYKFDSDVPRRKRPHW